MKNSNLFSNIKGDLFGGLTAGVVALPLALAFGQQTELGAVAGLYGAIVLGVLAAIFGGTATQISGPTAPMTVVSAVVIADTIKVVGSLEAALPIIVVTFILSGFLQILFGLFKLGSYIKYIPYPVISGFMSGIGVIIIITQIFPFFGVSAPAGGPLGTIRAIHNIPEIVNAYSVSIAVLTILIIYFFPKITKAVPSALIALISISILSYFFLPENSFSKINSAGELPSGLPKLYLNFWHVFADFKMMIIAIEYAFTLAALGAIDSLLTSIVADNMTKTKHNSNQELIGQGIGNLASGLIAGLPGAGATMRTVVNINSGGKTKLSGLIAGLLLLAVLLGLGFLIGHVPNAVLAGILLTVGISIIDYKAFRHIQNVPKTDVFVMLAVLLLTVFVDLLVAVAVGMVFAALLFMKKIADFVSHQAYTESLQDFSREVPWIDEGSVLNQIGQKVYIKHLNGPLFFGFASRFQDMIRALPEIEIVIIRMEKVPYIDQSGLYAMEDAILKLKEQNIKVVFTGLIGQPLAMLKSIKLIPNLVPKSFCFCSFEDCLHWLNQRFDNQLIHANVTAQSAASQAQMTPEQALVLLKKGNERFVCGKPLVRDLIKQVYQTESGQYPFAAVLSCIDSRAPIEKIFDQGIGDIFNARIAGNFVNPDILGSLEFACKIAGARLVLVLGHTNCGAIKGACDAVELGNLTQMLAKIKPAVDSVITSKEEDRTSENSIFVNEVAKENVLLTIERIKKESEILRNMEEKGQIRIVGGIYDVKNGQVDFLKY